MAAASKKPVLGHWLPALLTSIDQNQNQQGKLILSKWSVNMTLKKFATQWGLLISYFFFLKEEQDNRRWKQLMTKLICRADTLSHFSWHSCTRPKKPFFSPVTTTLPQLPGIALTTDFSCLPQFTPFAFCAWGACIVSWVSLTVPYF